MFSAAIEALGTWTWQLDGWIVVAGILCAVSSALLGSFLVLRGLSLLGDAIAHAVLPGLAVAFLISGTRSGAPMFLGAVVVGVLTTFFVEWLRRVSRVEQGASMGVVFTTLFALGLLLIGQAAPQVDLDPDCVLYGAIELTPLDCWSIGGWLVPKAVITLGLTLGLNLLFVVLFYKELKLTSFDPSLADSQGCSSQVMHYLLMTLVAITAVASFESVGSVLVVAMLIVPAAAALLLTDRLIWVLVFSCLLGALAAIIGHVAAVSVPAAFGYGSTLTAGMMAVAAGGLLLGCGLFGPHQGLVIRWWRLRRFSSQVLDDDIVSMLFRVEERLAGAESTPDSPAGSEIDVPAAQILEQVSVAPSRLHRALVRLRQSGELESTSVGFRLTAAGRRRAQELVRAHRLWELYLVEQADRQSDRIHDKAETWEHVTDQSMRAELDRATSHSQTDPHGARIPPESEST